MARFVRFQLFGESAWGRVGPGGTAITVVSDPLAAPGLQPPGSPRTVPWDDVTLNAPVPSTGVKIVAVARNYRAHAAELNNPVPSEPLLFLKPPSALIGPDHPIVYPTGLSELVHHEGELAVVMGRRAKNVRRDEALSYVGGYTLFNDVTARDLQRREKKFTRGKGFDTFGPIGPWIDTDFSPADQLLTVSVNGQIRQKAPLSDMIFDVAALIAFVSRIMTLERYDVIATGTPAGVGPLVPGDSVQIHIAGLGTLENTVVAGDPPVERWDATHKAG